MGGANENRNNVREEEMETGIKDERGRRMWGREKAKGVKRGCEGIYEDEEERKIGRVDKTEEENIRGDEWGECKKRQMVSEKYLRRYEDTNRGRGRRG